MVSLLLFAQMISARRVLLVSLMLAGRAGTAPAWQDLGLLLLLLCLPATTHPVAR